MKAMQVQNMVCYLIDDDPEEYEIIKIALENVDRPVDFLYFRTPESAMEHAKSRENPRPDVIFLDVNIPAVDVHTAVGDLLKVFGTHTTKLLLYSSVMSDTLLDPAFERNHLRYFKKLSSIDSLTTELTHLFNEIENEEKDTQIRSSRQMA